MGRRTAEAEAAPARRSAGRGREGAGTAEREFLELVAPHDRRLRALAYRLLGSAEHMDDALQEAYLRAYRSLDLLRSARSPGAWLRRVTYNVCLDELRRRSRRHLLPLDDAPEPWVPAAPVAERTSDRARLAAALAALPPDQRAVVLMVDAEGFDHPDAAEVLGVPVGTVKSRLSRARAALRRELSEEDHR